MQKRRGRGTAARGRGTAARVGIERGGTDARGNHAGSGRTPVVRRPPRRLKQLAIKSLPDTLTNREPFFIVGAASAMPGGRRWAATEARLNHATLWMATPAPRRQALPRRRKNKQWPSTASWHGRAPPPPMARRSFPAPGDAHIQCCKHFYNTDKFCHAVRSITGDRGSFRYTRQ